MHVRNVARLVVAATAVAVVVPGSAGGLQVPSAQKITLTLESACKDGVIDQAKNEESCRVTLVVSPRTPNRSFTLQQVPPGSKKWEDVSKFKSVSGTARVTISGYEEDEESGDEAFRDGRYSFRVVAIRTAKEKAYTGSTFRITFKPDDTFDDDAPDEGSSGGTNTTTPTNSGGTNGGTPTMTTTTVSPANFYVPVRTSAEITSGNLCANNGGPVSTSICDSLKTPKSKSDMTTVLAGIGSIYVRDNFCRWIFGYMDKGVSFTDAGNLCAEVNAKS
ncbi:MAG: hypothetical protein RLZZ305_1396 [Actinomycetota bacterium]